MQVTKRNGSKEDINLDKIHKVVAWACEGLDVSPSQVEINARLSFKEGISTSDIQEALILSAGDLITEETPDYQYVAGRLINYHLRKIVYNSPNPPHILDHYTRISELGFYDSELIEKYSRDEWDLVNSFIDHEKDMNLTYVAMEQFRGKYLVKNRATKEIYETPQMVYALIAMTLFCNYKKNRMKYVKDYYDAISNHYISLPTPIMAGVRTPQKQYSSCVLIDSGDSLDSIGTTGTSILKYVSQRAGIGVNLGRIRAIGSKIRKGDATHTGILPYIRFFQDATKSCSQGGVRGGAATFHYPIWHYEAPEMIVLKNNKGIESNRIRHVDYSVQINGLMYERIIKKQNISLFSPSEVPGLYDAFFNDQEEFKRLYEMYEADSSIRKITVNALDFFFSILQERKDTGRIYIMNVDNVNSHSSFIEKIAPVFMSNLCQEITLPTKPLNDMKDEEGEIALCTLSAINWGKIRKPTDFEKYCDLAVRGLDELLDYQNYPVIAAEIATKNRRPLGVGIINFAYWLTKNGSTYSNPDLKLVHRYAEAWSYYLIKASSNLAKEKGNMPLYNETKYSLGILPIDTYKKSVDELVEPEYNMDWEALREQCKLYMRNSTLMALMPSETSSQIANATNGIEPPKSLVSLKGSKEGLYPQVVPSLKTYRKQYETLWEVKGTKGYLDICAVLQKFIDQSISVNTSYNPKLFPKEMVPMSLLLKDAVDFYRYGGKCLYYCNSNDSSGEENVKEASQGLNSSIENQSDIDGCDSCKI